MNLSLEEQSQISPQEAQYKSPREIFNSIRRLLCSSTELFDSVRQNLQPHFQELFPSAESFRQLSTDTEENFSRLNQSILDTQSGLNTKITHTNSRISELQQSLLDTQQSLQAQIDQLKEAENN